MADWLHDFEKHEAARDVSEQRRRAQHRVLERFLAAADTQELAVADPKALEEHLRHHLELGRATTTLRTERQVILSFYEWAYRSQLISADTLLGFRAVRSPARCSSRGRPKPYGREELKTLWRTLDDRWPRLPADEAERLAQRWVAGKTPYSRIRRHAIRLQLESIIGLALVSGLRRHEIITANIDDIHPDNAYAVVWGKHERWGDVNKARRAPYTSRGREAVGDWLNFRELLRPNHEYPWLSLWREQTALEPMKRDTFEKLLATYIGPGWTLKRLRDTCAVNWLKAGLHAGHLREVLGLKSIRDTLSYAEAATGDVVDRADRLSSRFDAGLVPAA